MEGCELCQPFNSLIKPDSYQRACINPKCSRGILYLTPFEHVQYYLFFLRKTLYSNDHYQILVKKLSSRFSRDSDYRNAWIIFIDEVVNIRNSIDISRIGVCYSKGIGIKKSTYMADLFYTLSEKYRSSPIISISDVDKCPVCISNPDNGDGSVICETCAKMICNFCHKRLKTNKCPCCNQKYETDTSLRIKNLRDIISKRSGRNIENAKVFLSQLILKHNNESLSQVYTLLSDSIMKGCSKGYHLFGMLYMKGIGCNKNIATAIKIFGTGIIKGQTNCMTEMGRIYINGIGIKKNKMKGLEFYKMAALNGNTNALIYLHKEKS